VCTPVTHGHFNSDYLLGLATHGSGHPHPQDITRVYERMVADSPADAELALALFAAYVR